MDDFEKEFQGTFPEILKRTGTFLYFLYPPTRCVGQRGSMPVFVQTGRALFDVAGWQRMSLEDENLDPLAVAVGIELKRNSQSHTSMRIVGEDGSGSGIQSHQLAALASLHRAGGIARLLWNNGGDVGVLYGDDIASAFFTYGVSVEAEKLRKAVPKGARSIAWSLFHRVDLHKTPGSVIIEPAKDKTVAEVLKASKRKARKQTEEAQDESVRPSDLAVFMDNPGEDDD